MMKIVAPISRVEEVALLARAGADEIYCGLVPPEWTARFGTSNVNRRLFGNLKSYAELQGAVDAARRSSVPISLVLNAQHYADRYLPSLIELACRFAAMGGSGLIVADLGLLALLASQKLDLRLHLSSVATCRNKEAARLAHELGAARVILPRDVTVREIAFLAASTPELEFEAFVLNDACVFEEGVCHSIHLPGRLGGPICLDQYDSQYRRRDGKALSAGELEALRRHDAAYRQWLWQRMGCGFSVAPNGLPLGPCGLCALPALAAGGVHAIKIAGREAPSQRKETSVHLVRRIRDLARQGSPAAQIELQARAGRGESSLCDAGAMCYYRPWGGGRHGRATSR